MSEITTTDPSTSKSGKTDFSEDIAELLAQTSAPKYADDTSQSVQASGGMCADEQITLLGTEIIASQMKSDEFTITMEKHHARKE